MKNPLLFAVLFTLPVSVAAQSLYAPRAVKRTYAEGTRAYDGNPGPNYWQNRGRYTISIATLPPDRRVSGHETITYFNNSPDSLSSLVIRLLNNIHKPGAPRTGGSSEDFLTSGVHIRSFTVNGQPQDFHDGPNVFTVQRVRLDSASVLAPHDSIQLSFDWWYDVSVQPGREGMIDSTTYYLAYFYPRVAVYDDYNGWDTMGHTGFEFYSDFNDYDVSITVPGNFTVWGTGTLTNAQQVLAPPVYRRYQSSFTSDSTIVVATGAQIGAGQATAANPTNTWHFASSNVPDVAFGLSDHYDWDAASVAVDGRRRASAQAAYNDTAADFHHMVQFVRHSLDFLSHQWPGVPYPYEKMTGFQGGAGMEYPMMANDEAYANEQFSQFVVAHEIAHTYMPFYMGINETRYAFMDEGWATTFEYLINLGDMGPDAAGRFFRQFRVNNWARSTSPLQDLPIITPADALTGGAYGINAYGKPALAYLALKDMLGDDMFRRCLHAYMSRWNGKHPTPWDFFYTFDNVSGSSLDWFWNNWFFSNNYIDLAAGGAQQTSDGWAVTVNNVGGMAAPFDLVLTFSDGSTQRMHQTAGVWAEGQHQAQVTVRTAKTLQSAQIDGGIWVDADTSNNTWND